MMGSIQEFCNAYNQIIYKVVRNYLKVVVSILKQKLVTSQLYLDYLLNLLKNLNFLHKCNIKCRK